MSAILKCSEGVQDENPTNIDRKAGNTVLWEINAP